MSAFYPACVRALRAEESLLCVGPWVGVAGSRQHLEMDVSAVGCNSDGLTVLLDLVHELSVELGAVFAFCADFQRVTDNRENVM